jgi:hypothetical protein
LSTRPRSFDACWNGRSGAELTACTARRTFSSTGKLGKMLVRWNERPTPALVMRQAGSPVTSRLSS